jgi:lysophospholipid acyltransferase (LPLAT)-like uncharacterized protein
MSFWSRLTAIVVTAFYSVYSRAYRVRTINDEIIRVQPPQRSPVIFAHWHEDDLTLLGPHRNLGFFILVSLSKDGDLLAHAMNKLGYHVVRGSSSRGGARALLQIIREVRAGNDTIITVDGPRGPRHEIKPGILTLSWKTQAPIVTVSSVARSRYLFRKSWSQTYLPWPFTRVFIDYGHPIPPPESDAPEAFEKTKREVEQGLIERHRILSEKIRKSQN